MGHSKVMIVEDERVVALSIKEILSSEGYEICGIASSANQALKAIAVKHPDLVVMDVKIKGRTDGIETAKTIRRKYNIPSIYLTAFSDKALLDRAKLTEPMGYILKPFKPDELISAVKVALHKSRIEEKKSRKSQELEAEVKKRTRKLNEEILYRKAAEKELRQKTEHLKEANKALKALIEIREAEKRAQDEAMLVNLKMIVSPYIEIIENQTSDEIILNAVHMLGEALKKSISPASQTLFAKYLELTPQEVKIADLIRQGKKTKDIAGLINIAPSSVSTYRYSIRKKLGLLNSSTSLERYLNAFDPE